MSPQKIDISTDPELIRLTNLLAETKAKMLPGLGQKNLFAYILKRTLYRLLRYGKH